MYKLLLHNPDRGAGLIWELVSGVGAELTILAFSDRLWILKNTILEFFKRLTSATWEKGAETALLIIRVTFVATFIAVVISDLAECQPFDHYWQVLPDPGGQCRQGYAQLLTMATCNIFTDLLLVLFPIPIILRSHYGVKKKVQLTLLFSLSLAPIGVTLYRVPHVIWQDGNQQLRSLLASVELLFATTAANALVLGSFVRDRGVKKSRFKYNSFAAESAERSLESRRPTMHRHWGSDEDLVRDIGLGVEPELREVQDTPSMNSPNFTPAPIAKRLGESMDKWQFPQRKRSNAEHSDDSLLPRDHLASQRSTPTPRRVSFFDVGGLLDDQPSIASGSVGGRRESNHSSIDPLSPHSAQSSVVPAGSMGTRRGSTALLQDLGGLLGHTASTKPLRNSRGGTELQPIPQSQQESPYDPQDEPVLMDPGGLLK